MDWNEILREAFKEWQAQHGNTFTFERWSEAQRPGHICELLVARIKRIEHAQQRATPSLLRQPVVGENFLSGCYCEMGRCMAPRGMVCRDPSKRIGLGPPPEHPTLSAESARLIGHVAHVYGARALSRLHDYTDENVAGKDRVMPMAPGTAKALGALGFKTMYGMQIVEDANLEGGTFDAQP